MYIIINIIYYYLSVLVAIIIEVHIHCGYKMHVYACMSRTMVGRPKYDYYIVCAHLALGTQV